MAVRIAELEAKITADNRDFERKMAQSERSAKSAASSIRRSFSGDPFKDFNKNIAQIDRKLKELERPRNVGGGGGGRGGDFREAGKFLEELSRGDSVEALVQLTAGAGAMGIAFAGAGLVVGATALAIGSITKLVIEQVREVDQLAKATKRSTLEIQAAQIASALTGESVEDLAENYSKLGSKMLVFEGLVKSNGAQIDADLRRRAQDAGLAFYDMQQAATGALYAIAREALPAVTDLLRDTAALIRELSPLWADAGQGAAGFARAVGAAMQGARDDLAVILQLIRLVTLQWGAFQAGREEGVKTMAGRAGSAEEAGQYLKDSWSPIFGGHFSGGEIERLTTFGPTHKFTPKTQPKNGDLLGIPSLSGNRKRGRVGASDADAARRAQLELEKAQAAQLLALEQRRITEELELLKRAHEQKLLSINSGLNAEIDEFNRYYNSRTSMQEQSIALEIENEKQLYYALDAEQKNAKKQSEKLRLETEKTRIAGRLDILRLEQFGIRGDEDAARANQIKKAQEEQRKTATQLASAYKDLQSELIDLNGSDYDKYLQNLQRTTKELYSLAFAMETLGFQSGNEDFIKRGAQALDLIKQYTTAAEQQFQLGQLGRDRQGLETGRALQFDRINTAEDAGLITQGRAYEQRIQVQRAMTDVIVENLRAEQAILEALGKHNEALQVQREIEQAMVADFDVRARQRLVDFQDRLSGDFTGIIDELVSGTESVTDVLKNGLRNLILTTLKTMEETLVENLTGVKGGLGGMLGNVFGSLISGLFGGGSAFAGASASGFAGFAEGGHVMGGLPVRWNEGGAKGELFVPEQSGYILNRRDAQLAVSNAASMRSGGNTTIINFHVTSQDGRITRESQSQAAAKLAMAMREAEARNR